MVKKNCTLPFSFYCLTDNPDNLGADIISIEIHQHDESYWSKINLFSNLLPVGVRTLYLDLDVVIQKNFDHVLQSIKDPNTITTVDYDKLLIDSSDNSRLPRTSINTSIIGYITGNHSDIYDHFNSNSDYYMLKYQGLDRYLTDYHYNRITTFSLSDFYFRCKEIDSSLNNAREVKFGKKGMMLFYDPDKPFCLCNGAYEFPGNDDWIYKGLEKYFL